MYHFNQCMCRRSALQWAILAWDQVCHVLDDNMTGMSSSVSSPIAAVVGRRKNWPGCQGFLNCSQPAVASSDAVCLACCTLYTWLCWQSIASVPRVYLLSSYIGLSFVTASSLTHEAYFFKQSLPVENNVIRSTDVSRCWDSAAADDCCSQTVTVDVVCRVITSPSVDQRRRGRPGGRRWLEATHCHVQPTTRRPRRPACPQLR